MSAIKYKIPSDIDASLFIRTLKHLNKCFGIKSIPNNSIITCNVDDNDKDRILFVLNSIYLTLLENPGAKINIKYIKFCQKEFKSSSIPISKELSKVKIKFKLKAKGKNQEEYIKNIETHDLTFGLGPAGTGKTFLACALALKALNSGDYGKIILTRPIVETDEKLGFLPGTLEEKISPYIRPLYDAMSEMIGNDNLQKLIDEGLIELSPLAYMRGRTLSDAFVILDEAQNTTVNQMKMFLTRLGFNSKMVVNGDLQQSDVEKYSKNGLRYIIQVIQTLIDDDKVGLTKFENKDVIRHPLIIEILECFDKIEKL